MGDFLQEISMRDYDLHERLSFQAPEESTILKKTFHAISRLKSVANISNETDPDGKTKSS